VIYGIYLAESIKPNFSSMATNIKQEFNKIGIYDENSFLDHVKNYFWQTFKLFKKNDTLTANFVHNVPGYQQRSVNKSLGTIINNDTHKLVSYITPFVKLS